MPRLAGLDAPGVLHHVIIRGIERRGIFRDDIDRENFFECLLILVPETQTICYAWVFMPKQKRAWQETDLAEENAKLDRCHLLKI